MFKVWIQTLGVVNCSRWQRPPRSWGPISLFYRSEDVRSCWRFIPEQLVDSNLFLSPLSLLNHSYFIFKIWQQLPCERYLYCAVQAMRRTCVCLFQISPVSAVLDFSCFRKMHLLRTNGGPNGFSLVFPAVWVAQQMLTGRGSLHSSVALHLPRECPPPPAQLAPELCWVPLPCFSQSV